MGLAESILSASLDQAQSLHVVGWLGSPSGWAVQAASHSLTALWGSGESASDTAESREAENMCFAWLGCSLFVA